MLTLTAQWWKRSLLLLSRQPAEYMRLDGGIERLIRL